ncbi:hypothetical protein Ntsu_25950 [Nocardia sp. IFM 10818]
MKPEGRGQLCLPHRKAEVLLDEKSSAGRVSAADLDLGYRFQSREMVSWAWARESAHGVA